MMVLRNPSMSSLSSTAAPDHRRKSSSDSDNLAAFIAPLRTLEAGLREQEARREGYWRGPLPGGPTLVRHKFLRLLISSAPHATQAARYAAHLHAQGVRHVVRVCEPTYNGAPLRGADLQLHDWRFADGDVPPPTVIRRWLKLLDDVFDLANSGLNARDEVVAVHCMAGLGRAPMLVAIALIEAGVHPFEAVGTIRAQRRGAINSRQMAFLNDYVPRRNMVEQKPARQLAPKTRRQGFGFSWMKSNAHKHSQMSVAGHR